MKNGREKKEAIFKFIAERIPQPKKLSYVFGQIKRRKDFAALTESTFKNAVRALIQEGKLTTTVDRESHPKRKPIILITAQKQPATV